MSCPSRAALGEDLTFSVRAYDANGAFVDADSLPTYDIYEGDDEDTILSGTMPKFDDDNTTGLYAKTIEISEANGFEQYKSYTINIETTVNGASVAQTYSFIVGGTEYIVNIDKSDLGDLRAVTSYRGSFIQGQIADLLLKITNFNGIPLDPISLTCTITGPTDDPSSADEIVSTGVPFQAASGYYVYEWDINSEQAVGKYIVTWNYIINNIDRYEKQYIYIVKEVDNPLYYSMRMIGFRGALEKHLSCAQNIPVYNEQAKSSRDKKTFHFSFPRWNQSPGVKVYRNKQILNSGVEVDYFNGSIVFDDELLDQDIINADYNFQWFSEADLDRFIHNACYAFSMFPPSKLYLPDTIPDIYITAILMGAVKDALRQIMMCLQLFEPQLVFGGPERAQQVFSNLETLKKNYENDWDKMVDVKKFGPYPIGTNIVVPEYTLPGGRSRWFRYLFS